MAKKKDTKAAGEKPTGHPRTWTPAQRREAFLASSNEDDNDYQVMKSDFQEELVPYGFLTFDKVMNLGGIARRGRVTQVHGDEGAGKSSLVYTLAKNYQQFTGEPLAIYDFERTGTPEYLKRIGVDMNLCFFKQPDSVEECIKDSIRRMIDRGVRLFVYDSIPRMKSKVAEKDIMSGKAFKANFGKHAQTMSRFYDILLPYAAEYDCQLFMINQTRDRIEDSKEAENSKKYPTFINKPYSLPGGRICRFTPSVMVEMKLMKALTPYTGKNPKDDPFLREPSTDATEKLLILNEVRCRAHKNKVTGGGYREGTVYVRPGYGIDENVSIRDLARKYKLIQNHGKQYFCGSSFEDAFITYASKADAIEDLCIKQNPEVLGKLKLMVSDAIDNDTEGYLFAVDENEAQYLEGQTDVEYPVVDDDLTGESFDLEEDKM